jgi:hypothetical protein
MERLKLLQQVDAKAKYEAAVENDLESAKEAFCNDLRSRPKSS